MRGVRGFWVASTLWLVVASCTVEVDEPKAQRSSARHYVDAGMDAELAPDVEPSAMRSDRSDGSESRAEPRGMSDAGANAKREKAAEPVKRNESAHSPPEMTASEPVQRDDDAGAEPTVPQEQATLVGLGERLFRDPTLSLTGTQSCSSCHEDQSAFTGSADRERPRFPVSRGAPDGQFGTRNTPTAMYAKFSPPFAFVEEAEEPGEYTPTGGLFWDGRVSSLSDQAAKPFINPREMALPDTSAVIERVRKAGYVWMFEPLFGPDPLDDSEQAYRHVTDAIAAFERTARFSPFSSKFDAYLRGQVELSAQEARGFELFKDPEKANCIACHVGTMESREPRDWLFTDFTYDNLGVPRNLQIADNSAPDYFDLGLCQSEVVMSMIPQVIMDKDAFLASLCGAFKVPTLRNVAKTAPYMHNGYFEQLRDVVDFYVTRETEPARWYPSAADGTVQKYNDLPERYLANVNTTEVPYDRKLGEQPRLTPEEIDAVVAFLTTLSDGYDASAAAKP